MNSLVEIVLWFGGAVAIYGLVVSIMAARAIRHKRYEAYRRKRADFHRLDEETKEAFAKNK